MTLTKIRDHQQRAVIMNKYMTPSLEIACYGERDPSNAKVKTRPQFTKITGNRSAEEGVTIQ